MRKNCFSLFLLLCFSLLAASQKAGIRYSGSFSVGFLSGKSPAAVQLQVVNGVQYKTWSAGLGAGLDYYHTRSVPLFLQLRKTVSNNRQAPFFYLNSGFNVPWAKRAKEVFFVTGYSRGFYGEGGIGYELPVLKNHRLFFSGGWQVKTFKTTVNTMPWSSVWPLPPNSFRDYDYSLHTIAVKAGLRF